MKNNIKLDRKRFRYSGLGTAIVEGVVVSQSVPNKF